MLLEFVWIKDYGVLKEIGLNFSNEKIYSWQYDIDGETVKITRSNSEQYIDGFYGEYITQLNGVVGQNGSGKTTLIRFLLRYLVDGSSEHEPEAIVIYKEGKQSYVYCHSSIKLSEDKRMFLEPAKDLVSLSKGLHLIYHSNHFDTVPGVQDFTKEELTGQSNLSTSYLLKQDFTNRSGTEPSSETDSWKSFINAHQRMEFNRMAILMNRYNNKGKSLLVTVPQYIVFELYQDVQHTKMSKLFQVGLINRLDEIEKKLSKNIKKRLLFKTLRIGVLNILANASFNISIDRDRVLQIIVQGLEEIIVKPRLFDIDRETIKQVLLYSKGLLKIEEIGSLRRYFENIDSLYTLVDAVTDEKNVNFNSSTFFIHKDNVRDVDVMNLLMEIFYFNSIAKFIDVRYGHDQFNTTPYSSGELAILSLFARFTWLLTDVKNEFKKKNVLILLDEAEIGLHPQWQLEFLKVALNYFNSEYDFIFHDKNHKKNVSLIITSHSPFIVSDIPSENLIYLKRNGNKSVSLCEAEKEGTFGANIHRLFQKTFFVENGLIGKFAQEKIDTLIQDINQRKKIAKGSIPSYLRRIKMIGEPFIKDKLMEMLESKVGSNDLDPIIEAREQELAELKKRRKGK